VTIDNEFEQETVFARLQVRPSDDSRLAGRIGYAKRRYDTLSQRDFGGIVGGLNVDWRPTGALTMRVDLFRDIQSEEVLTASYVDVLTLAIRPTMRLTGKTVLRGLLSFSSQDYEGDPGFSAALGAVREDDITAFGIGLGYEVARNIEMNFDLRRNERKSNYERFSYTDNLFSVNLLARF
jgi:hypothetical protein